MIIGCVVFIFCILGIYGYFDGNIFLTYIGLVLAVIEHIIGIYTGEEKGLTTIWLSILCALGMTCAGNNLIESLAICLCFENVICFGLGIILFAVTGIEMSKMKKHTNSKDENHKVDLSKEQKYTSEEYEVVKLYEENKEKLESEKDIDKITLAKVLQDNDKIYDVDIMMSDTEKYYNLGQKIVFLLELLEKIINVPRKNETISEEQIKMYNVLKDMLKKDNNNIDILNIIYIKIIDIIKWNSEINKYMSDEEFNYILQISRLFSDTYKTALDKFKKECNI